MNDSDPFSLWTSVRPMPPEVARAYRDPLNLTDLLASAVFTDRERFDVRDELLERLVRKHGNVEVEIGKGTRTLPICKRVAQFKKNVWSSIEVVIAAEELGGHDAVMLELASVMQPYWLRWWEAMDWEYIDSTYASFSICTNVIGQRQFVWLTAQYARLAAGSSSTLWHTRVAIESAEAWAASPSEVNRDLAAKAAARAAYANAAYAANAAASSAAAAYSPDGASYAANAAASAAAASLSVAARKRLCDLTKQLITPTLITHASRGLR